MKSIDARRWSITFVLLFSLGLNGLQAQFTTGMLLDDPSYAALPQQSLYGDGGKSESQALEGVLKVDLRPYCPKPKNQGRISSCVGWATGYAALSIQYAFQKGWKNLPDSINRNAFSALFIYNQIKINECGSGSYISEGLKFLAEKGDLRSSDFDLDVANCNVLPNTVQKETALRHRVKEVTTLFGDMAEAYVKIYKTKLSLAQNKPVVIGMEIRANFQSLTGQDTYWFPDAGNTQSLGGHAMCVVGFDEGKGAFEVMNSWGEYWGQGGFIWIKYDDFARFCRYAAQFTLQTAQGPVAGVRTGQFRVRQPVAIREGVIEFAEAKPVAATNRYLFQQPKGARVQWTATGLTAGTYLYVFSFDPQKNIKVHWPRDESLDQAYSGKHESALVTTPQVELVIPSPQTAFTFNQPGKDHVVALVSTRPITDLNTVLPKLKTAYQGDLAAALRTVFGSRLASATASGYRKDAFGFSSTAPANLIIPVILEVTVSP
jgi:hypothetical protein